MRIVVVLLALVIVLAWAGFELRPRDRALSNVLYILAAVLAGLLAGAFFGWY